MPDMHWTHFFCLHFWQPAILHLLKLLKLWAVVLVLLLWDCCVGLWDERESCEGALRAPTWRVAGWLANQKK
jgi:hypothetical protein